MNMQLQVEVKPTSASTSGFTPVRTSLLQRKCDTDECAERRKKKRLGLQTKLMVNEPGDIYEREADRIADQVMAAPAHPGITGAPPWIQRFPGQANRQMDTPPASVNQTLASPGRPLESALQKDMGQRFGHDFSRVRVHSDAEAEQSARDVSANAYTVGHNMVFGAGRFAPETHEGRRLLAHELVHVVQQESASRHASSVTERKNVEVGPGGRKPIRIMMQRDMTRPGSEHEEPQQLQDQQSLPKCGPDVTDWFVSQVNTAMTDSDVLGIQSNLRMANMFASYFALTASQVAEAGTTAAVLTQEALLGSRAPARNPTISSQLVGGIRSSAAVAAALPTGVLSSPTTISPFISPSSAAALAMTAALGIAALSWRNLVNHAGRYDFKAHRDSMNHPTSPHCPDEGCPPGEVGIITLCPGSNRQNCYESDLPGNLFYALIGRHAGWSRLTLQLGSQLAELTDVTPRPARPAVTWDTPDDTAAINLGYRLPLPLTRSAFCGTIPPARSSLAARHGCADCMDVIHPRIR